MSFGDDQVWTTLVLVAAVAGWTALSNARSGASSRRDGLTLATLAHAGSLAMGRTVPSLAALVLLNETIGPHSWVPLVSVVVGCGAFSLILQWQSSLSQRVAQFSAQAVSAAAQRQARRELELAKHYEQLSESKLTAHVESYPELRRDVLRLNARPHTDRVTSLALIWQKSALASIGRHSHGPRGSGGSNPSSSPCSSPCSSTPCRTCGAH